MTQPLGSWNDTPSRQSIVDYVAAVAREGSPDFSIKKDWSTVFADAKT